MIEKIVDVKKLIPDLYVKSIYDIDFNKLYDEGKRIILSDLDNTLVSYQDLKPTNELIEKILELKSKGFEFIIVSNNSNNRVKSFCKDLKIKYFSRALKPCTIYLKKAMQGFNKKEVIVLGDQLLTDVFSAKRLGVDVILVKACERKTEKWTTKNNRIMEKRILNEIKKKYPDLYLKNLASYEADNYGN